MDIEPLQGSCIKAYRDIHSTTLTWMNGKTGIIQYPVALFMIFWLGGWTFGGFMAAKELFTGEQMPLFARGFLLFWLGGWAFGECAVIYALCNILKPLKPSKLILSNDNIEFQTGTKALNPFGDWTYQKSNRKKPKFFSTFKNKLYKFKPGEINNLKLDYTGDNQKLTFDIGAERIEIGPTLTEPEREWLYNIIKNHGN
ncbi:MAG: hypothetical protein A2Y12_03150 [Planctomycetes bacterium GWF2_42_9]|nr:MAG: hypothetical protein A2Y12_03150 [Planctomycetes bacterium GWF2_42_9]